MQGRSRTTAAGTTGLPHGAARRGWRSATVAVPLVALALTACVGGGGQPVAAGPGSAAPSSTAARPGPEAMGSSTASPTATSAAQSQEQKARTAARQALLESKRKAAAVRAAARQRERAQAAQRARAAGDTAAERRARRAEAERRRAAAARRPAPTPTPTAPAVASPSSPAAAVLVIMNRERAEAGCRPLVVHPLLAAAAAAHSKDMAVKGYFSHTGQDGRSPFDRIKQAGYPGRMMGENIAAGQTTAAAVMQAWMNSPGHRANILNCGYREVGVGYVAGGSMRHYWTQNFGSR